MARIYVSSTYLDLKNHREQVSKVLRRMGHEDVAMEYYVAEDQRPLDRCLADVASCAAYLGIFAWRYGWIPPEGNPDRLSITELEYREAEKHRKSCLIFLLSEDHPWPPKLMDNPRDRIEDLRRRLSEPHSSGPHFHTPEELGLRVAEAVHAWEKGRGGATPRDLLPEVDLAAYSAALRKRYQRLDLDALTPPQKEEYLQIQLRSVVVEPSVRPEAPPIELPKELWERIQREQDLSPEDLQSGMTREDLERARELYSQQPTLSVLDVLADPGKPHVVILGDPGAGKSTLTRYVLLSLLEGGESLGKALEGYFPLLVELRTYAGLYAEKRCDGFLDFLGYLGESEGWQLPVQALHDHLARGGRALILFDGLDEIFDAELRDRVSRRIAGFAASYPRVRIVVTSRIVGYKRVILADSGFAHFTLQDLDEKQVSTFVRRWYDLALSEQPDEAAARVERIERAFHDSLAIRQLAGNPMLLTIMSIIGKHQELPRERWKLYDHAVSVLVQHWDVNKHLRDKNLDADLISEGDKKHLLRELAFRMQAGGGGLAGNYIYRDQLQEVFEGYLARRFYGHAPDRAALVARRVIEHFRERNFILSLHGAGLYGFVHRAFLEFFCASAFVHRFEKTQELTLDQLKSEVYGRHWEDRSWHEVLRLICGMIDPRFAGGIIAYLMNDVLQPWSEDLVNRLPWNIALAVQCLGEIEDLTVIEPVAVDLLRTCCRIFEHALHKQDELLPTFVNDVLTPAASSIGMRWPGRENLLTWLTEELIPTAERWISNSSTLGCGTFVGSLEADDRRMSKILRGLFRHENLLVQSFAVQTATLMFPGQLSNYHLLREALEKVQDGVPRLISMVYLTSQAVSDPLVLVETSRLLRTRAVKDKFELVRLMALRLLTKFYHNDPETLPLLRRRALTDKDHWTRREALQLLAESYQDDPGTLPFLRERALKEKNELAQQAALDALARLYPDDPETLQLLSKTTHLESKSRPARKTRREPSRSPDRPARDPRRG